MKKIFYLIIVMLLFNACKNDLELIEEWKDIPIVYGVLDPSDTAHYLRIEKAFIDNEISGVELAMNPDSFYYKDLEVQLIKGNASSGQLLTRIDGNLEGYPREEGAFAGSPNYLYKIKASELSLNGDEDVTLKMLRATNPVEITSRIKTIGEFNFLRPRPDDPEKINMSYANHLTIRWNYAENAVDYEVFVITHYEEKFENESDDLYLSKKSVWKAASGVESNSVLLNSKDYFTFIGSSLEGNKDLVRKFDELEFVVLAVGQELSDYIAIGGANLGITASQEIPQYSNLSEGLGVFSSKWEIRLDGLRVIPATLDSIQNGIYTKHLNFQ